MARLLLIVTCAMRYTATAASGSEASRSPPSFNAKASMASSAPRATAASKSC